MRALGQVPWLLALLIALAGLLIYAAVKRLIKLALLLLLVLAGVVAWFRVTHRQVPADVDRLARMAGQAAQQAVDRTGDLLRKGQDELDSARRSSD
jgi:hypothetical protein